MVARGPWGLSPKHGTCLCWAFPVASPPLPHYPFWCPCGAPWPELVGAQRTELRFTSVHHPVLLRKQMSIWGPPTLNSSVPGGPPFQSIQGWHLQAGLRPSFLFPKRSPSLWEDLTKEGGPYPLRSLLCPPPGGNRPRAHLGLTLLSPQAGICLTFRGPWRNSVPLLIDTAWKAKRFTSCPEKVGTRGRLRRPRAPAGGRKTQGHCYGN